MTSEKTVEILSEQTLWLKYSGMICLRKKTSLHIWFCTSTQVWIFKRVSNIQMDVRNPACSASGLGFSAPVAALWVDERAWKQTHIFLGLLSEFVKDHLNYSTRFKQVTVFEHSASASWAMSFADLFPQDPGIGFGLGFAPVFSGVRSWRSFSSFFRTTTTLVSSRHWCSTSTASACREQWKTLS